MSTLIFIGLMLVSGFIGFVGAVLYEVIKCRKEKYHYFDIWAVLGSTICCLIPILNIFVFIIGGSCLIYEIFTLSPISSKTKQLQKFLSALCRTGIEK